MRRHLRVFVQNFENIPQIETKYAESCLGQPDIIVICKHHYGVTNITHLLLIKYRDTFFQKSYIPTYYISKRISRYRLEMKCISGDYPISGLTGLVYSITPDTVQSKI